MEGEVAKRRGKEGEEGKGKEGKGEREERTGEE